MLLFHHSFIQSEERYRLSIMSFVPYWPFVRGYEVTEVERGWFVINVRISYGRPNQSRRGRAREPLHAEWKVLENMQLSVTSKYIPSFLWECKFCVWVSWRCLDQKSIVLNCLAGGGVVVKWTIPCNLYVISIIFYFIFVTFNWLIKKKRAPHPDPKQLPVG